MRTVPALLCLTVFFPTLSNASCDLPLYEHFKNYRQQINQADQLEQLSRFFSNSYKQYYKSKINKAVGKHEKQRYLNQYWDNLGIAKDIIIVYDYDIVCRDNDAILKLTTVLDNKTTDATSTVDFWRVTVRYEQEGQMWRISQLEYNKSGSNEPLLEANIVDNFLILE